MERNPTLVKIALAPITGCQRLSLINLRRRESYERQFYIKPRLAGARRGGELYSRTSVTA